MDVAELGVDLLSLAGHKLYAPKGVGVLYVRRGVKLEPLLHGAGHEGGRRAGTENVPYAVGLGAACRIARAARCPRQPSRCRGCGIGCGSGCTNALGERVRVLNGHPERRSAQHP